MRGWSTVAHALLDESWAIAGVLSPDHWLSMRADLSPFHARQVVSVARRRGELPTVMGHFADGQLSLDQVSAPADAGALVEAALKEAKAALFRAGQPQVTWGDAMIEVASRSLGAVTSINRRDAYRTYVHLDTEGGWLTGKPRLPQQITKKLTCDGILQPVWRTQGAPVNVGSAQRIVPARTRRLVEDRDRGCRFPGCPATAHVECHHVIHWVDGGPTDTWNLACLCPFHHDGHHDGDFTIAGNADQPNALTFTTRAGHLIRPGPTFTTPTNPTPKEPRQVHQIHRAHPRQRHLPRSPAIAAPPASASTSDGSRSANPGNPPTRDRSHRRSAPVVVQRLGPGV